MTDADLTEEEIPDLIAKMTPAEKRAFDRLLGPSKKVGLYGFIPKIARGYTAPRHLAPLVDALEASWTSSIRRTSCAPPRHGKTDTILAFIALTLLRYPHKTIGYVTYEDRTARSKSRKARLWAEQAGVKIASDAASLNEWRTTAGGGLLATGVGGPLTGQGVDCLIVDDPYKNRIQAESGAYRSMVADWWGDVAETRVEPGGSVFIIHTRWVEDDLIGHIQRGEDAGSWKHIPLPALSESGVALWPERWTAEALEQKRRSVGEYTWSSLFQGSPRSRGGRVFGGVTFYDEPPATYRQAFGVDLAYSRKTHSDRSIAVGLVEHNGYWHLTVLRRRQVQAPAFAAELKEIAASNPGAPWRWYCSGTELGSANFMQAAGVPLGALTTTADKFIRAQPVAARWNDGRVLIPRMPPPGMTQEDLDDFVRVVCGFTGVNDAEDDDVDALAAAFDLLPATMEPKPPPATGTPAWQQQQQRDIEKRALERHRPREDWE